MELNNVPNLKSQNSTVSVKDKKIKAWFPHDRKNNWKQKDKTSAPEQIGRWIGFSDKQFPLASLCLRHWLCPVFVCLFFFSSSHFSTLTSHRLFGLFSLCWDWLVLRHQSQFTPSLNRSCHNQRYTYMNNNLIALIKKMSWSLNR